MIMVILGGVGHLYGGVLGAVVLLLLEEVLSGYTIHWQLGVGAVLLAIVLFAPQGLAGAARAEAAMAEPLLRVRRPGEALRRRGRHRRRVASTSRAARSTR